MRFIEFTATSTGLKVIVENATQPTLVRFELDDQSTADVSTPTDITGDQHTYEYAGDYSDGVYACTVNPGESDEITAFITNMLLGMNCMLQKTLRQEYDCALLQELKATEQYTFLQQEDLARGTYDEVRTRCTQCEASYVEGLSGISIWIINNDFVVQ